MSMITTGEAADILNVSRQRVDQLLRDGTLTGRQVNSRMWLVALNSVHDRNRIAHLAGRPWQADIAWRTALTLSDQADAKTDVAKRICKHDVETIAGRIAQHIQVRRYTARSAEDAAHHLSLTGESAIKQIHSDVIGSSATVHGYARGDVGDTVDELGLVEDPDGSVLLYSFSGGNERFQGMEYAPDALIAVDCMRSTTTRVRSAGRSALEQMAKRWQACSTK